MNNIRTFQSTRIKLTIWYLLISLLISFLFSFVIYFGITREIDRIADVQKYRQQNPNAFRPPPNFPGTPPPIDGDFADSAKNRMLLTLVLINGIIFAAAGTGGYFLAGRTLRPIKKMMDDQARFITDASHELKTPLTSMRTELEVAMLKENIPQQESQYLLKSLFEEVTGLQRLAERLIELTHQQKKNSNLHEEVSLVEVIEVAIKKVSSMARKKNTTFQIGNLKEFYLFGDKLSICEMFVILLDNAVKYSHGNSVVIIESKKIDTRVAISIKDHGIGMDGQDAKQIFDRFFRADKSRSQTKGYGLGLSIAKEIVVAHKGTIVVKSKLHEGSTFVVTLPESLIV